MDKQSDIDLALKMIEEYEQGSKLKDLYKLFNVKPSFLQGILERNQYLSGRYDRAQRYRAESLADEIIHISDTENDYGKARNQIDARKWYASKIMPAKYGDRIDVSVTQVVDIGAALEAAKRRVALPDIDLIPIEIPQPIETLELTHLEDTGSAPELPPDVL